jgi:pyruvate dehydrogenase E2 component (dihydrolipoyllysine-residue acetyltransferase)
MTDIVMPRLSDSMEEGTILTWIKQVGEEVAVGEEIVEIETDKANMAYESDVAGTLTEIIAPEGATLAIGEPIARIGDSSDTPEQERGEAPAGADTGGAEQEKSQAPAGADVASFSEPDSSPPPSSSAAASEPPASSADGERVKASPVARRLAKEQGIDLTAIQGSGPGGRIVKKDVKAAAAAVGDAGDAAVAGPAAETAGPSPVAGETAKGQVTVEELSKLQQVVARRMSESKATAPHFYLQAEIEMSKAAAARRAIKAAAREGEVVPSFNDMVVKACAIALGEFPKANGAYRDGRFELYSRINVGVAVAAEGALVVPTIFDAERKGLRQIAAETRAVAARVRDGSVTPPELSGGTFTVSNLGMFGIDNFAAVINSPQAAILAVGAIVEKPAVRNGEIVAAQLMNVTLACDHRILYGAEGAEFLARVRALLEEPVSLAL